MWKLEITTPWQLEGDHLPYYLNFRMQELQNWETDLFTGESMINLVYNIKSEEF